MSAAPDDEPIPDHVGPYRVLGVLGGGGMGVVYRAVASDGAPVAVKVVRTAIASRDVTLRFARESKVRIDHPNVVRVIDAGQDDDTPWIAFELLEGETFAERMARGPMPIDALVPLMTQAIAGLSAAHALGVVHRDLKPPNLFVCSDGTVKVLDFGIALADPHATRFTSAGAILGTPAYLAPEQARGELELDARTDVWALGVVMWEALVGRTPFEKPTPLACVIAVIMESPPPPSVALPGASSTAMDDVVMRCLAKDRAGRFASVAELADALGAIAAAHPSGTHRVEPTPSIAPGEARVVALLLASEVHDLPRIERAIRRRGGLPMPLLGHRAAGLFGGHASDGDELVRAVEAALDARGAAGHIGVASGRATSAGGGIAGDVVASVEHACAVHVEGVAVARNLERMLGDHFVVRAPSTSGAFVEVVDRAPRSAAPATTIEHGPLIGREIEHAQLREIAATSAHESRASAALVIAPPGGGKSRLLASALTTIAMDLEGAELLRGRGEPLQRDVELSMWRSVVVRQMRNLETTLGSSDDAIRALAATAIAVESDARDCADFLGELLGIGLADSDALRAASADPQLMRDRLRLALLDWLEGMARRGPLVLALEDLQWADDASLDLLEALAERVRDRPVAILTTARPELLERRPSLLASVDARRIELRGLGLAAVASIARTVAGRALDEPLVRALHERTGGNPLFIEHIVLELRDRGQLHVTPDALPLPVSVEAAVQSRLDHLPPIEKELCKRASVIGRPFAVEELEALGLPSPSEHITSLVRRELLVPRSARSAASPHVARHWFRNALVADVAYRLLATDVRAELHARIATHLSTRDDGDPEDIARHFDLGGRGADAARHYARAVIVAARHADGATVLRCADRALALGIVEGRFALQFARAEALLFSGRRDEELGALEAALASDPTPKERARVLVHVGSSLRRAGRLEEARVAAEQAVAAAHDAGDPESVAVALGWYGVVLIQLGRLDDAERAIREAALLGDRGGPLTRIYAASWRAQLAAATGDLGARCDASREAARLASEAGDPRREAAHAINLADAFNRFGAYTEAADSLRAALDRCRRVGNRLNESYAHANLGYALAAMGRVPDALAALSDALRLATATGQTRLALAAGIYRLRALAGTTDPTIASREAIELADRALALGARDLAAGALTIASRYALGAGDIALALSTSERALALRDELGGIEEDEADIFLQRVAALRAAGLDTGARDVAERGRSRIVYLARRIANVEWRRRFVEDVPAHRAIDQLGRAS